MMTMEDVCAGYLFWIMAGKREYGIDGIKGYFYQKRHKKLMKRRNHY